MATGQRVRALNTVINIYRGEPRRPWPSSGMTTDRWMDEITPRRIAISDIILVQDSLDIEALVKGNGTHSGDPYPHVIAWGGLLWLEDGHHRVVRDALMGATHVEARLHEA